LFIYFLTTFSLVSEDRGSEAMTPETKSCETKEECVNDDGSSATTTDFEGALAQEAAIIGLNDKSTDSEPKEMIAENISDI